MTSIADYYTTEPRRHGHRFTYTRQYHVHVRVANLLGSFYELSTLKLIYTGCTAAAYAAPCRTAVSFTQLLIDVGLFSLYFHVRTYASRRERCSREILSSRRNFFYFSSANTLTCARLPPVTHPPTPRTCRQPAGLM